ncbi:DUF4062 domain-containing protein [Epilithonimonas pallida]|uniref:DUF4062 domain-containing protein n=1 Tax=Epilithonimonas pallida TaxID=373671 RepID=A0ABY1R1U5_9FLAO|nr:DUF4062 domain-containing protein [Epilithonimonas pallida]SMP88843.1 protein of unknown function [Epilithonimonas pallida]
MAIPRVFISSTCYDLKYIRENLKFFIRNLGYEPILSEDGDVFYNPKLHTHDSCITEIETCQLFVLIIGGRYGGSFKESEKSITNQEYVNAVKNNIPIFALVEQGVYSDHFVYTKNKENETINYPAVDNKKIFEFIDEVRKNIVNNAIVPFRDFNDMETYLKKQWAGMMHFYLTNESETKKVSDLLNEISNATQKIEFITKEIATSTIDKSQLLDLELYEKIVGEDVITLLKSWKVDVSPKNILKHSSFDEIVEGDIEITKDEGHVTTSGFPRMSKFANTTMAGKYISVRNSLKEILKKYNLTIKDYIGNVS